MVLSQFTDEERNRATLADYVKIKGIHPAGRLDYDSEGLMVLTGDGALQARISQPRFKLPKTYWVQVEGEIEKSAIERLRQGITLKDGKTKPAQARVIPPPNIWEREPPVRYRANIPTSWIELTITEGKNRQVRRMTAAVGFPTLRLVRSQIGSWSIADLKPGELVKEEVHLPAAQPTKARHSAKQQYRSTHQRQTNKRRR